MSIIMIVYLMSIMGYILSQVCYLHYFSYSELLQTYELSSGVSILQMRKNSNLLFIRGGQYMAYGPNIPSLVFVIKVLLEAMPIHFILSIDAFSLWWKNWVFTTEIRCPVRQKYLLSCPLQKKKVPNPNFRSPSKNCHSNGC